MMLTTLLRERISLVWAVLILATVASWTLGVGHELPGQYASVGIIVIAFVKVRLVGGYFMEIRHAPIALKVVFHAWTCVLAVVLIGLYTWS